MSKAQISMWEEKIVDSFAGGGGASTGIELATGRVVDIAINHDPDAILMHKTNHPHTVHYQASVWDVDPLEVTGGSPVGLLWASPDCKHFSKAKGGKPVDKRIRGLAWIVLRWAGTVRPRVIILENVEEFQTWGPVRHGHPIKAKTGQTFRRFIEQLEGLDYAVEWRELVAADYGAPTTRKRFFLIARCDGRPIVWPEPTHAPAKSPEVLAGKKLPWRSAAEIIDWSLPCPSIFDTREEIREKYGLSAQRPLRPNTMRRVARGVDKFVIKAADPFITPEMLTNPAFAMTMIVIFVGYFFSYTLNAGCNAIGLNVYGIDSSQVSNLLVWSIILAAIMGFAAGPIIQKIGRKASIILALACMGGGLIAVAFLIPMGQIWALAVAPCIYYFGTSFFYQPIVDTATLTVEAEESGRALGFNDLMQAITGSVGVAIFGQLMANGAMSGGSLFGTESGPASTYANVFMVGGIIVLGAMVIFICSMKMIYSRSRVAEDES